MKIFLKINLLKEILARKNKSQNWFAHKLETSSGYMSQLMNGTRHPSPKLREKIIAVLSECSFDDLFEFETKEEITKNENELPLGK